MQGRVLTEAFNQSPDIRWIDSWESLTSKHAKPLIESPSPETDSLVLQQLVALGYMNTDDVEGARAARIAGQEALFNLATVHLDHGRPAEALPLFQQLCAGASGEVRHEHSRMLALSHLGRHTDVLESLEKLEAAGDLSAQFDLLAAAALAGTGQSTEALDRLRSAAAREPSNSVVQQVTGDFHLARGRRGDAKESYANAIQLDPDNGLAYCGMSQVQFELGNFNEAEPGRALPLGAGDDRTWPSN